MTKRSSSGLSNTRRPQILLLVGLVAVGMGNISVPSSIPLLSILYLPASLVLVFAALLFNIGRVGRQLRYPVVVLFVFLAFVPGFLITPLNPYGENKLLAVAITFLLVVSPSAFRNIPLNLELVFKAILGISIITSVMLLIYGQPDVSGRSMLWGLNPISTGRVSGVGVVILCALFIMRWKLVRPWWIFVPAILICFLATVQTGSRGPILAIGASIITVLAIGIGDAKSRAYRAVIALAIAGGTILFFSSSAAENSRITSVDANGRDALFSAAMATIRNNPVGIGWGNFYLALPSFPRVDPYTLYPHNVFLEIGAEGGWIALGAFILLLIYSIINLSFSAKVGSYPAAMILSLLVFTLVNASLSSDFVGNRLLWLSVGLSLLPFRSIPNYMNQTRGKELLDEITLKRES